MNWIDHILLHYLHYLLSKNVHIYTISSKLETLRELLRHLTRFQLQMSLKNGWKPLLDAILRGVSMEKFTRISSNF